MTYVKNVCGTSTYVTPLARDSHTCTDTTTQENPEYESIFDFKEMSFDPWYAQSL